MERIRKIYSYKSSHVSIFIPRKIVGTILGVLSKLILSRNVKYLITMKNKNGKKDISEFFIWEEDEEGTNIP